MKKLSLLFVILGISLSDVMCFVVAYNYRELLCGIEHRGFSALAEIAFLIAIPFVIAITSCFILAFVFYRKAKIGSSRVTTDVLLKEHIELASNETGNAKPKKKFKAWKIVLLALGSPLWVCLLLAVFAVVVTLYLLLWTVIISLWALFASIIACGFGILVSGAVFGLGNNGYTGIAMIGGALVCIGLSIFLFFGCKAVTKGTVLLTKKIFQALKRGKQDEQE